MSAGAIELDDPVHCLWCSEPLRIGDMVHDVYLMVGDKAHIRQVCRHCAATIMATPALQTGLVERMRLHCISVGGRA